jgi:hypothetical protein
MQAERSGRNPDRPVGNATVLAGLQGALEPDDHSSRKRVTRISSPERWEIKQVRTPHCIPVKLCDYSPV